MSVFCYFIYFIIFVAILAIIYVLLYNGIQTQILKLMEAGREIDETLRSKFDIMIGITEILKNDDLDKLQDLKDNKLSSFEFTRELSNYESRILNTINNSKKMQKNEEIKKKLCNIEEINIKLEALKKYYDNNISIYNELFVKFPSNIVARCSKLKERPYFNGKNLNSEVKKDFKS